MTTFLLAVSLAFSIIVPSSAFAEEGRHAPAAATHAGRGKIISVDKQAGAAKLTHDSIKSFKWPKMTMNFKAHDAVLLKDTYNIGRTTRVAAHDI
ncbi:MAG: copper-binding protein [Burkholderiales bacterium]